jgi:hypothetical protein
MSGGGGPGGRCEKAPVEMASSATGISVIVFIGSPLLVTPKQTPLLYRHDFNNALFC